MNNQIQLNEALLNSIHKFIITLRRKKMSKDLIFHEFVVLRNILNIQTEKNTPLYPSDLSDRLNLSRSYVTSVLNSLEKKNLINRTVDLTDRRRILIFITDKGQQIFDNMKKKELEQANLLIQKLSDAKTIKLISLLDDASDILDKGE